MEDLIGHYNVRSLVRDFWSNFWILENDHDPWNFLFTRGVIN